MTSTPTSTAVTVVPAIGEPSDAGPVPYTRGAREPRGSRSRRAVGECVIDESTSLEQPDRRADAGRRAPARLPADPVRLRRRRLGRRRARHDVLALRHADRPGERGGCRRDRCGCDRVAGARRTEPRPVPAPVPLRQLRRGPGARVLRRDRRRRHVGRSPASSAARWFPGRRPCWPRSWHSSWRWSAGTWLGWSKIAISVRPTIGPSRSSCSGPAMPATRSRARCCAVRAARTGPSPWSTTTLGWPACSSTGCASVAPAPTRSTSPRGTAPARCWSPSRRSPGSSSVGSPRRCSTPACRCWCFLRSLSSSVAYGRRTSGRSPSPTFSAATRPRSTRRPLPATSPDDACW